MIFLHPEFLWGLWALIIPIIIHLFDFRKNRKVYFPDIRFLKQVQHSSSKPLKLKHWLILLARLGFIFFLIILFAQPTIPAKGNKILGSGAKLIYLDNSQSMSGLVNEQETALEIAKKVGQDIIGQFDKNQEVVVISNNTFGGFNTVYTPIVASEKIANVVFSDLEFSLNNLKIFIDNFKKNGNVISDVFILSDFQKSTTAIELTKTDTLNRYWLSPIANKYVSNCVVDSTYLVSTNNSDIEATQLEVVIANYGFELKEEMPIKIFVGNRQVSAASITIPPHQKKIISFSLGKLEGTSSGYVQLEDFPNTFDNIFYFSIPEKNKINVVDIIGDQPSPFIKSVFGNKKLFNFSTNNYQNIEEELVDGANFIILNQIQNPSVELINKLKSFAINGGTVLIVPSSELKLSAYQQLFPRLELSANANKQQIKAPSSNSPFFRHVLKKSAGEFEMFESTPVCDWGQDRSALLAFEDETPFLSEISNHIYFISSPLNQSYSSFQSHALFVPVMYGLASLSTAPEGQNFNRIESDYYMVTLDSIGINELVKLKKEELEIIPEIQKQGSHWRMSFPANTASAGVYNVNVGTRTKGYLALNLTKNESQLTSLNKEELSDVFADVNINYLENFNGGKKNLTLFDTGIGLWKFALTICLVFLLLETLFIRFL